MTYYYTMCQWREHLRQTLKIISAGTVHIKIICCVVQGGGIESSKDTTPLLTSVRSGLKRGVWRRCRGSREELACPLTATSAGEFPIEMKVARNHPSSAQA